MYFESLTVRHWSVVGLGFAARFQWEDRIQRGTDWVWKMVASHGSMIKNPFFPTARQFSSLSLQVWTVFQPLPIIPSMCLGSCGVCDRGTVCLLSKFKPTDITTDEFDTKKHDYGLATHPEHIAQKMSCNLSLPRTPENMSWQPWQNHEIKDKVCISNNTQYLLCIVCLLTIHKKKFSMEKKKEKKHNRSMSLCLDARDRAEAKYCCSRCKNWLMIKDCLSLYMWLAFFWGCETPVRIGLLFIFSQAFIMFSIKPLM